VSIWINHVTRRAPPNVNVKATHANTKPRRDSST